MTQHLHKYTYWQHEPPTNWLSIFFVPKHKKKNDYFESYKWSLLQNVATFHYIPSRSHSLWPMSSLKIQQKHLMYKRPFVVIKIITIVINNLQILIERKLHWTTF
jgi:hypothetical protein